MNCKRMIGIISFVAMALVVSASSSFAHCEIPCGIYGDELRVYMLKEHIQTIEKSMNQIVELSTAGTVNHNQLVRWVGNKEDHANEIQEIVTQYFMTQRVKTADPADATAVATYTKKLSLLHGMLIQAMKAKQTTDIQHVKKLKQLTSEFHEAYFGKTEKEHLREHHE